MKIILILFILKTTKSFLLDPSNSKTDAIFNINSKALTHQPFTFGKAKHYETVDSRIIEEINNNIDATTEPHSAEPTFTDLIEHRSVIENINFYTYVVSILEKDKFLSAGALIKEDWVLTAADSLYFKRDRSRFLRVRLGSTNYKKKGVIAPVKYIEIHPYFDDTTPEYDVALVKLARTVQKSQSISSIRIQKVHADITSTHFILTSWQSMSSISRAMKKNQFANQAVDLSHKACLLKMTHIHPMPENECKVYLEKMKINTTDNLMCLDSDTPCLREIGAPVVLDRVLWGVVSSYVDDDCSIKNPAPPMLVTKTSSRKIFTWIRAIINNEVWKSDDNAESNSGIDFDYNEKVFD